MDMPVGHISNRQETGLFQPNPIDENGQDSYPEELWSA
jgi:hypothetical protein